VMAALAVLFTDEQVITDLCAPPFIVAENL